MKYYQVSLNPEPSIIGVTNGIYQVQISNKEIIGNEKFKEFEKFFNYNNKDIWKNQKDATHIKIPFISGKLLKKAKVTDIMGYTQNITFLNNLYSDKFLKIIDSFDTGNYVTFKVAIENVNENYYMIFFNKILFEDINYERSIIYSGNKPSNNIIYHNIDNLMEFRMLLNSTPICSFEKLSISKQYLGRDLISIQAIGHNFYSERLIDFLLDCGVTGLSIGYTNSIKLDFS